MSAVIKISCDVTLVEFCNFNQWMAVSVVAWTLKFTIFYEKKLHTWHERLGNCFAKQSKIRQK